MASGDSKPFRSYIRSLADGTGGVALGGLPVIWQTDTIKAAFLSVAPDFDEATTDIHWDDVSANEVLNTGTYPAGGETIGSIVVSWDGVVVKIDGVDVTVAKDSGGGFANAIWVVVYKDTGVPSTSPLLIAVDLGGTIGNITADYVLQWGATGIWRLPITDGV